jgi:hypothetical protein
MNTINVGEQIEILCEVQPGPFPGEHLISVETLDGPVSGFVTEDYLRERPDGWRVRGIVQEVRSDSLKVMLFGSFFTTNGLATIQPRLAMAA